MYQRKLEEARLADALDRQRILNVAILEQAAVPALAANQYKTYLLLFGFLAASFLSLAAAFVVDYLERHLPTVEAIRQAPEPRTEATVEGFPELAAAPASGSAALVPVSTVVGPSPPPGAAVPVDGGQPRYYKGRPEPPARPGALPPPVTVTRQQVDSKSGDVTTTTLVVASADAWRELFERRTKGASRPKGKAQKFDAEFLNRLQDAPKSPKSPGEGRTQSRG
jgi:hypothetical protein